ncbi:MAG: hypothetical protein VYD19_10855 [Myxococcota bacterium]|nr:hypothetical protein [Myxococcota bacterium]
MLMAGSAAIAAPSTPPAREVPGTENTRSQESEALESWLLAPVETVEYPALNKKAPRRLASALRKIPRLLQRLQRRRPSPTLLRQLGRQLELIEMLVAQSNQSAKLTQHREISQRLWPLFEKLFHVREGWATLEARRFTWRPAPLRALATGWLSRDRCSEALPWLLRLKASGAISGEERTALATCQGKG